MRATVKWQVEFGRRFGPRDVTQRVAQLKTCSPRYFVCGSGEPLVLVPGLAGGFDLTARVVRVLARHYQIYCCEMRDEGNPLALHRPHTVTDLSRDLLEFMDLQYLERPTVLGLSYGSAVALKLASSKPGRVGRLIIHGAGVNFGESLFGVIAREVLERYPLPHDSKFLNQFFRLLFARREQVGSLFDFVAARCWQTDQSVIAHRLRMLAMLDLGSELSCIHTPTLVIAGRDDAIVDCQSQRVVADSIPGARFAAIERAGHLCFLTRPHAFAEHVRQFVGCT